MPDTAAIMGLHTPITNINVTESSIIKTQISEGSVGSVGELEIADGEDSESLSVTETGVAFEAMVSFKVPDLSGLDDIGVASFGLPAVREAVIGTDERVRVKDTGVFPWCAFASLLITAADNTQYIGTAWFISPRTLATAGHCVYIKDGNGANDGWVKKIQVMPGRNGDKLPFGGLTATEFMTVKGWGEEGLEEYDYGAIILPSAFPQDLGYFSFGVFNDDEIIASTANVAGYPFDKDSGTLWYDNKKVGSVKPEKVYYDADTEGGQSGGPVYIIQDKKRIGIAVHAYGGRVSNSGTRISSQVYSNFESWKKD